MDSAKRERSVERETVADGGGKSEIRPLTEDFEPLDRVDSARFTAQSHCYSVANSLAYAGP